MSTVSTGPSPHLSWAEIACSDGTAYPLEWRADRAAQLAIEFELVRAACCCRPLTILSGYRTTAYNATVPGSARNSQHVQGRALDLATPEGMTARNFYALIRGTLKLWPESKIRGIGVYPAWGCHIDIRPSKTLVEWEG